MSNTLKQVTTTDPYGKSSECGLFTVDTPDAAFVLSNIAITGQTYTFSCWVKSSANKSVTVNDQSFPSTTQWKKHAVTFVADSTDVRILFSNAGTYYIYHPQLEQGNKPTDWNPAPEDVYLDLSNLKVGGRNYILQSGEEQIINLTGSQVFMDLPFSAAMLACIAEEMIVSFDIRYESAAHSLQWGFYFRNDATGSSITKRDPEFSEMTGEYVRYSYPVQYKEGCGPENFSRVRFAFRGGTGTVYIKNIKLESGSKPTDWTPAPEDVEDDIAAAQNTANSAKEQAAKAEALIEVLEDRIRTLVRDANGESVMTNDGTGWYFSTAALYDQANAASQLLEQLVYQMGSVEAAIEVLSGSVDKFGIIAEYVHSGYHTYKDENGDEQRVPCIDLWETDTGFKLKITNTAILFTDGTTPLLTVDSKAGSITAPKAILENELQIGANGRTDGVWVWKQRANGNLGLSWVPKGVSS